ncbi:hypothetical protein C5S29_00220 [ANME-1 cluster archaeon GoMg3.2]|nr:hypothetical protein [ANME-1 cluster archaeon GoMg3.2]
MQTKYQEWSTEELINEFVFIGAQGTCPSGKRDLQ